MEVTISPSGSNSSPSSSNGSAFTGMKYGSGAGNTVTSYKDNRKPICNDGQVRRRDGSCTTPSGSTGNRTKSKIKSVGIGSYNPSTGYGKMDLYK
jgi:hypothetical protein